MVVHSHKQGKKQHLHVYHRVRSACNMQVQYRLACTTTGADGLHLLAACCGRCLALGLPLLQRLLSRWKHLPASTPFPACCSRI